MAAVYVLPSFNLTVGFWRKGRPLFLAPSVTSLANLSPGRLTGINDQEGAGVILGIAGMWLRLPKGTDARDISSIGQEDRVEAPLGSQRYYAIAWVDDIGSGFPNEHRFASITKLVPSIVPWPAAGGPFPAPAVGFPILRAALDSANTAVPNLVIPFTLTVPSGVVVLVGSVNQGAVPLVNMDGAGLTSTSITSPQTAVGAMTCDMYAFPFSVPLSAGSHSADVTFNFAGVGGLLVQVWTFPDTVPVDPVVTDSGSLLPSLFLPASTSATRYSLLTSFILVNPSSSLAMPAGWSPSGTPLSHTVGADTATMDGFTAFTPFAEDVDAGLSSPTVGDWSGIGLGVG